MHAAYLDGSEEVCTHVPRAAVGADGAATRVAAVAAYGQLLCGRVVIWLDTAD